MELIFGKNIIESTVEEAIKNSNKSRVKEIVESTTNKPITKNTYIAKKTEVRKEEINNTFDNIFLDLNIINDQINRSADELENTIKSAVDKFNNIEKILNTEKERQEDLNMLCGKESGFKSLIEINNLNTMGNYNFNDDVFSLKQKTNSKINYKIIDISGNGYEGNKYVYKDDRFKENFSNTANRKFINDDDELTYYEYSRITVGNEDKNILNEFNTDSIYAQCAITIASDTEFNMLELNSKLENLMIEKVLTSNDQESFSETSIKNIRICNKHDRFKNKNYVYGSGIIEFPKTKVLRLVLKATENTSDKIAFKKDNDIIKVKSGKRSAIRINDLKIYRKTYEVRNKIMLNNFITEKLKAIAIFANEYMENDNMREYIKYTLTINGIAYDLIPINSQYNGKKIIRISDKSIPGDYVIYINEEIKDASLDISISTNNINITPYISNIKILLGGK